MVKTKNKRLVLLGAAMLTAITMPILAGNAKECVHEYESVVILPTCTSKGYTTHFCKDCGYEYTDEYTSETGHEYHTETIAPTCEENGYDLHSCDRCGETYMDNPVTAIGHAYESMEVKATCMTEGYTEHVCSTCGDYYTDGYIAPTGHEYQEEYTVATCVSYGYTEHSCKDCEAHYVTDYVKPYGHSFVSKRIPATETEIGYTEYTCKSCSYSYATDFVTSGDDGYLQEEPQDNAPNTETNAHIHSYALTTAHDKVNRRIEVSYVCNCGSAYDGGLQVLMVSENGDNTVLPVTGGQASLAVFPDGAYDAVIVDENGNILSQFTIKLGEETQDLPPESEPSTPPSEEQEETEQEPTVEEETQVKETPDKAEQIEQKREDKKGTSLWIILTVVLVSLVGAGVVTVLLIKKQKSKSKTKKK